MGPAPHPPRDGDKIQARQRINVEVRMGRRPHPNTLPCTDCGHVWKPGERRHEYDHHKGYGAENHYIVEPVCTTCHAERDSIKKKQGACLRGHSYTKENTITKNNGRGRQCRECTRIRDRARRGPEFWRKYREERRKREANGKGN